MIHYYRTRSYVTKIGNTACGIREILHNPYIKFEGHNSGTTPKDMLGTGSISKVTCVACLRVVAETKRIEHLKIQDKIWELTR